MDTVSKRRFRPLLQQKASLCNQHSCIFCLNMERNLLSENSATYIVRYCLAGKAAGRRRTGKYDKDDNAACEAITAIAGVSR